MEKMTRRWVIADPAKLLDRMNHDVFHPERDFETDREGSPTDGGFSNVTFVENLLWFNGEGRFYYDAANSMVASAVYHPRQEVKN